MRAWVVGAALLALTGCESEPETGSISADAFISEIEGWDSVLDAAISGDRRVYVAMHDNGDNRDGYAMTVCEELRAHSSGDLKPRRITIIDAVSASRDDDFVSLGKHRCEL